MNESIFLLDKRVVFDSTKMTLSHGNEIIRISEAETICFLLFGMVFTKKKILFILFGKIVEAASQNQVTINSLIK
ncbi:response regulator [Salmonella enterica subsp. enterica]|uniref:Response regulator n=1 Tax=Salmonella enterica I TaxID=59201 RepID=A0A447PRY9_SALET|nr:response regulator [Salmonella enterica subsp. enterica]